MVFFLIFLIFIQVLYNLKINQRYSVFRGDSFLEPDWAGKLPRKGGSKYGTIMNVLVLILFSYGNDKSLKSLVENIIEPNY